jgi:natural product precursor
MKTKKLNKRLSLNKKTIADLNKGELKHVHGGNIIVKPATLTAAMCGGTCVTC